MIITVEPDDVVEYSSVGMPHETPVEAVEGCVWRLRVKGVSYDLIPDSHRVEDGRSVAEAFISATAEIVTVQMPK